MTKLALQRAAPHEGERRDLDRAAFDEALRALGLEHVVEGVVERPQVGVDLGHEVARQEAEPFAGLDGGAGEDDPVDLFRLERPHGCRDGEVGLAGSRRTDPEGDRVRGDGVDVAALSRGHRADRSAAGGPQHLGREHLGGHDVGLHHLDRPSDVGGVDPLAAFEVRDELVEDLPDTGRVGSLDRDLVAAHVDRGVVELPLDEQEELVPFAEQPDHEVVTRHLDLDLGRGHVYGPEGTSGSRGTRARADPVCHPSGVAGGTPVPARGDGGRGSARPGPSRCRAGGHGHASGLGVRARSAVVLVQRLAWRVGSG